MGPVFSAAFNGECSDCGEEFEEGDPIRYRDDDEIIGQECCGEDQARKYQNWVPKPRGSS